jgi:heat shock protein HslJ
MVGTAATVPPAPASAGGVPRPPQSAPSAEYAANATYTGIYDTPITLRDGRYEGAPLVEGGAARPTVGLIEEFQQLVDLDTDGIQERVVLLWENSGGSGTRLYLAHVRGDEAPAVLVGDRVQVRDLNVRRSTVVMDVLRAGPDDAMCCPGEFARVRWRGGIAGFEAFSDEVTGRLGLAALAGQWHLAAPATESAADDATPITLSLAADGTVAGRSGCNQYTGAATFAGPNALTVGPLGVTLMACPAPLLEREQEYLTRLQNVTAVGFHLGKLALSWQADGEAGSLLFMPR